jgi:sulfide dehydrogenase [flavocytochrome c] flavoprotein subunit
MKTITRRNFIRLAGGTVAMAAIGFPSLSFGASKRVVIVGGGIGGATAAKYIRMADPGIDITIVEPNRDYYTCFMSNEVLGGDRDINSLKFSYKGLKDRGIKVIHELVTGIDPVARKVTTSGGTTLDYDRCIVSPGVAFRWDTIDGYSASVTDKVPHAWKAGPQTMLLRKQIMAMKDGGTVIIAAPPNPFRCPPGPYERACQIAHYLQQHKPKSKVIVLDAKPKFSKQKLFMQGWTRHYGYGTDKAMIEWVSSNKGGKVEGLSVASSSVITDVQEIKGDVINIIPAQKAGTIAFKADLVNEKGWCPVNHRTFESTKHSNIHVIGDASVATPLPKSGYAASSEAKVCAAAVVAALNDRPVPVPSYVNTCYSVITPDDGISVAMVYRLGPDGKIVKVKGSGGLTPMDSSPEWRKREVDYGHSWFRNITNDTFG